MELIAVLKRDCETCQLVEPVLARLREAETLTVYCQDDPSFPELPGLDRIDPVTGVRCRHRHEVLPRATDAPPLVSG